MQLVRECHFIIHKSILISLIGYYLCKEDKQIYRLIYFIPRNHIFNPFRGKFCSGNRFLNTRHHWDRYKWFCSFYTHERIKETIHHFFDLRILIRLSVKLSFKLCQIIIQFILKILFTRINIFPERKRLMCTFNKRFLFVA